jgi:hypothetical protein
MGKGQAWVNGHHLGRYWLLLAQETGCSTCDYRGPYNSAKCLTNCGEPSQRWQVIMFLILLQQHLLVTLRSLEKLRYLSASHRISWLYARVSFPVFGYNYQCLICGHGDTGTIFQELGCNPLGTCWSSLKRLEVMYQKFLWSHDLHMRCVLTLLSLNLHLFNPGLLIVRWTHQAVLQRCCLNVQPASISATSNLQALGTHKALVATSIVGNATQWKARRLCRR